MANPNLLDIAILNKAEGRPLIEESLAATPEARIGAWAPMKGLAYSVAVRTALPSVGFRNVNEGVAAAKSTYVNRIVQAFLLDAAVEVDRKAADRYIGGAEAYLAKEAKALLEAGFRSICSQFYYGTQTAVATSTAASPTKGFPGLLEAVPSDRIVDAGGTTDDVASSAWLVKFGEDYVQWLLGEEGAFDVEDAKEVRLTDASSNPYDGYRMPITAYVGLQLSNPANSIVRIADLTSDSGKGLTDALIYQALDKFPAGVVPDAIFMNRTSRTQLRASRTATSASGAPAPNPEEVAGVPIFITDSIKATEKINQH